MQIYTNGVSPVLFYSALFRRLLLYWVLLLSLALCSRLERGSTRTNQLQKALCPPLSENTHAILPPFVCLPPTYTQHEHESFPCPQLTTMPHLCAPAHTPEYHEGAPWTSPSNWLVHCLEHPVTTVSLRFSLSVASSSTQSLHHFWNWWPHPTPTTQWLHQAAAAVKATEPSVGGGDN